MEMLTPQEVVEILRVHGTHISEQDAKLVLEFMVTLARITLSQFEVYEDRRPVHPGQY
jgi:hypothetical protein